jgi:hypothetical protein
MENKDKIKEVKMPDQIFKIIRAPEEPPLKAKELENIIAGVRTRSEWQVIEDKKKQVNKQP